jgi:muramoyltetrapeptide carboxypeptidase
MPATLTKPKALKPGDHIRVVTPASAVRPDQIEDAVKLLQDEGYKVTFGKHLHSKHGYLGGTDEERSADLMEAFTDPEVDCVMCSRGGYGCARLFPHLDLDKIAESGKMFCGFSDVTTLHLALNRRGLVTFHTPMPITLSVQREPYVYESFLNLLKGEAKVPDSAPKAVTLNPGKAEGTLTGGCLCLLCDSVGTLDAIDTEGKVLIIEDVDEHGYRVDALLTHLLNIGQLQKAAGVVIGEMTNTDEKRDPKIDSWAWREIVKDRLGDLDIPIMIDFPFGHAKNMLSVPMNVKVRMDADAGTLEFLESPCS